MTRVLRGISSICVPFLLSAMPGSTLLSGQLPTPTQVKYEVTCPRCTIERTNIGTLGTISDPVLLGGLGLERDSKGKFYHPSADRTQVVVFGADFKFARAVGRSGIGPGEFGTPGIGGIGRIRVGPGDSLWVFHSRSKVSLYSPTFSHVRTFTIPTSSVRDAAILRNGTILVSDRVSTPASIGHPYHVFSATGAHVSSFGGGQTVVAPGQSSPNPTRFVVTNDRASVWVRRPEYVVQRWTSDGKLVHNFSIVDIPWYMSAVSGVTNGSPLC